jgi:hypothetical protein
LGAVAKSNSGRLGSMMMSWGVELCLAGDVMIFIIRKRRIKSSSIPLQKGEFAPPF